MKYIRTKERENGLAIILKSEHYYHNELCYCGAEKTADTIEELCDEFVYLMKSGRHICRTKHTDIIYAFDNDKPIAYYGAIWTDKGLIYVAKWNKESDRLELL